MRSEKEIREALETLHNLWKRDYEFVDKNLELHIDACMRTLKWVLEEE